MFAGSCFANWCIHQSLWYLAHVPQTSPGQGVPTSEDRTEDQKPSLLQGVLQVSLELGTEGTV